MTFQATPSAPPPSRQGPSARCQSENAHAATPFEGKRTIAQLRILWPQRCARCATILLWAASSGAPSSQVPHSLTPVSRSCAAPSWLRPLLRALVADRIYRKREMKRYSRGICMNVRKNHAKKRSDVSVHEVSHGLFLVRTLDLFDQLVYSRELCLVWAMLSVSCQLQHAFAIQNDHAQVDLRNARTRTMSP